MIPIEWLHERLDTTDPMEVALRELEQLGIAQVGRDRLLAGAAFARWLDKWAVFVAQIVLGDELWSYTSPPETWDNLAGAAGYAIVRQGKPIQILNSRRS